MNFAPRTLPGPSRTFPAPPGPSWTLPDPPRTIPGPCPDPPGPSRTLPEPLRPSRTLPVAPGRSPDPPANYAARVTTSVYQNAFEI